MAVPLSAISRICGVDVAYKNFNSGKAMMLPQRLAIFGQGNAASVFPFEKVEVTNANEVADLFGWGSPVHLAVKQLFPQSGKTATFPVTVYPVAIGGSANRAEGKIAVVGAAEETKEVKLFVGGVEVPFLVEKDDQADEILPKIKVAIESEKCVPVTVDGTTEEELTLRAKFAGKIGNEISLEIEGEVAGLSFVFSDMENGTGTAALDDAFSQMGNVWETCILSCFSYTETSLLDKFFEFGEGRWSYMNKKPLLVAWGCTDGRVARCEITDARKHDFVNFLIQSTGSRELPFVVAAKGLLDDILTTANENPACDYKGLLKGLHTGADGVQEDYNERNLAMQKGASTNIKEGSVARLNDIVTMYHPENEGKYPSRRYVVDLVKLENVEYNVRLICESDDKIGAPLMPDVTQKAITNPRAVQPKNVKVELSNLADDLEAAAIIADAGWTKENIKVEISSENPKRLDVVFPVKLSGNIDVCSTDLLFGFYLGGE